MIAKCFCQECDNPIEFEAERAGQRINCPHCGKETVLKCRMKTIQFTRLNHIIGGPGADIPATGELLEIARANKLAIVEAVLMIEHALSQIIGHYFFPSAKEMKPAFMSLIVGSDWCSFAAKRKLVNHIITESKILENYVGIEQGELDRLVAQAMRYRNAFTHGKFTTDGKRVWLQYYEGRPIEKELTDEFLDQVKHEIGTAQLQSWQIAGMLGAMP